MLDAYEQSYKEYEDFTRKYGKKVSSVAEIITEQIGLNTEIFLNGIIGQDCKLFFVVQIYLDKYNWKHMKICSCLVENRIRGGDTLSQALLKEIIFKLAFETDYVHEYEAEGIERSIIDIIHNNKGELFGNDFCLSFDGQILGDFNDLYLSEINGFVINDNQAVLYMDEGRYVFDEFGVEFIDEDEEE